eukprot:958870-Pyramimonas_sp.AAC.1
MFCRLGCAADYNRYRSDRAVEFSGTWPALGTAYVCEMRCENQLVTMQARSQPAAPSVVAARLKDPPPDHEKVRAAGGHIPS